MEFLANFHANFHGLGIFQLGKAILNVKILTRSTVDNNF